MRPRIQIMGSTAPTTPLPRHQLHFKNCGKMGQDIPGTRREPRSLRQGFTRLGRNGQSRS